MPFIYLKSRFTRTYSWLAMLLLLTALGWFVCLYFGLITAKEAERENAYLLPVEVVITNRRGNSTENLGVSRVELWSLIKDKVGKAENWHIPVDLRPCFSEVMVRTSLYYRESSVADQNSAPFRFIGITSPGAITEFGLQDASELLTFFDGSSGDFENSKDPELIVSRAMLERLEKDSDGNILPIKLTVGIDDDFSESVDISANVTGYYSGIASSDIYCSWNLVASIIEQTGKDSYADSISAIVADAKMLDELREKMEYYFTEADPTGTPKQNPHAIITYYYPNAAVIHDELLRETLKNLGRNISVLRSLLPVIIALGYMIAAAAAYFYIHIRKRELAAARSLGTPATAVIMTIAIEMLIISAVSFAASMITAAVTPLCEIKVLPVTVIYLFAIAGAVFSAYALTCKHGLQILKEEN